MTETTGGLFDTGRAPAGKQAKTTTQERPLQPEVETRESRELVKLTGMSPIEIVREREGPTLIDRLAALEEGARITTAMIERLDQIRKAAIRATDPEDWVLFRDKQSTVTAMLCGPGADRVMQYYGIKVENCRPLDERGEFRPERIQDGDEIAYRARADVWCKMFGEMGEIEAQRSSSEGFVGRGGMEETTALVAEADLRASVYRLLRTKAVRMVTGFHRVPLEVLKEAWGEKKSVENCRKGSGFGTSTERGAAGVTDEDVAPLQEELRVFLLQLSDGEAAHAQAILKDITEFKGRWAKSVTQITTKGRMFYAWKALAMHKTYGTQVQKWLETEDGKEASQSAKDGIAAGAKEASSG